MNISGCRLIHSVAAICALMATEMVHAGEGMVRISDRPIKMAMPGQLPEAGYTAVTPVSQNAYVVNGRTRLADGTARISDRVSVPVVSRIGFYPDNVAPQPDHSVPHAPAGAPPVPHHVPPAALPPEPDGIAGPSCGMGGSCGSAPGGMGCAPGGMGCGAGCGYQSEYGCGSGQIYTECGDYCGGPDFCGDGCGDVCEDDGCGYRSCLSGLFPRSENCGTGNPVRDFWRGQSLNYRNRNARLSNCLFGWLVPSGNCGQGSPVVGKYHMTYAHQPDYFDNRDTQLYAAQGYGMPMTVPLAPQVRHTYNYSSGIPASRITPISNYNPQTSAQQQPCQTW